MSLNVKRESTIAGQQIRFKFENKGNKLIVKNFTDGDLYISLKTDSEETVRIAPLYFQVIMIGEDLIMNKTNIDEIFIRAQKTHEKGVEVQLLVKE